MKVCMKLWEHLDFRRHDFDYWTMLMVSVAGVEGDRVQSAVRSGETEPGSRGEPVAWTSPWQHRALLRPHRRQNLLNTVHRHGVLWGRRPCFLHQEDEGITVCSSSVFVKFTSSFRGVCFLVFPYFRFSHGNDFLWDTNRKLLLQYYTD